MEQSNEYSLNHDLVVHFDAALDDAASAFKDSKEFQVLSKNDTRYSDTVFLAEGGMKKIYSCFDRSTSRTIAKAVPKDESTKEQIDLFIREAKITAGLEHPHIVPVYELAVDDNKPYFTMKLLKGSDLGEALKEKTISQRELLVIFLKVCDAISYAHSEGVLHLDIKPDNINFDQFGDVLVCDWGLAQNKNTVKDSSLITGTPGFMAPEQYEGKIIGEVTDTYSLGALLYFMLSGKTPIEGKDISDYAIAAIEGATIPLSSRNIKCSKSLCAVVEKALDSDPQNRYQSASALAEEIRAYLNGFATQAEDASFLTIFYLLIKRSKKLSFTILFFLSMILIMTIVFVNNLNKEKNIAENAQAESMSIRKETAPELVRLAKKEYKLRNFETAEQKVDVALKLDPENEDALRFKIRCLIGNHRLKNAIEYISNLDENPLYVKLSDYLQEMIKIADKQELIDYENLPELIDGFRFIDPKLKQPNLKKHFIKTCTELYSFEQRLNFAKRYLKFLTRKKFNWIYRDENGIIELDISRNEGLHDLSVLRNLPINKLDVSGSPVRDLAGLEKMPLTYLNISDTFILDISPVLNCPLRELNLRKTNIVNIYGLKNTPVEVLHLNDNYFDTEKIITFPNLKKLFLSKKTFHRKEVEILQTKCEVIFRK